MAWNWNSLVAVCLVSVLGREGAASAVPNARQDTTPGTPAEVRTRIDGDMFPPSWLVPAIDARAVQLKPQEAERARRLIARAMAKYPRAVLQENLDRVYLVDRLAYSGISAAGTNSRDRLYLVIRDPSEGYTDHFVEASFHHEFSSVLLRNHRHLLDQSAWDACNPQGFEYEQDGVWAVKNGEASTTPKRRYMKNAFMSQYALSSMENDFNLLAEQLFMGRQKFWDHLEEFPKLREKAELIMGLYNEIDPTFTHERFRRFRPDGSETAADHSDGYNDDGAPGDGSGGGHGREAGSPVGL